MHTQPSIPVHVVHLLPLLDQQLIQLLQSLTVAEWQQQTIARLWTVKDVAAHLLDGNIRMLSMLRDDYRTEKPPGDSYEDLVHFINGLNATWVAAMKRVSPALLIHLHKATGPLFCDYYSALGEIALTIIAVMA
ncbi:MAG: maleylpyruvate isomerase N-terminal domain-containing protein [Williamsia sp.]|nr:maleylpyruvate isomerase N-terminal domain-containing protein [Williamsia sp.]